MGYMDWGEVTRATWIGGGGHTGYMDRGEVTQATVGPAAVFSG